jgi:hypothetical protein
MMPRSRSPPKADRPFALRRFPLAVGAQALLRRQVYLLQLQELQLAALQARLRRLQRDQEIANQELAAADTNLAALVLTVVASNLGVAPTELDTIEEE